MDKKCVSKENSPNVKIKYDSEIESLLNSEEWYLQYGCVSTNNEENPPPVDECTNQSFCSKLCEVLRSLTIEPVMFTFIFGYVMNSSVLSNMMMDKGCLYYYNYSTEICKNISGHKTEKQNIEILATNYSVYGNLLSFLAAFVMAFVAPWSDKYTRKLPLIIALFGNFLTDLGYILCTVYFDSRLEYIILSKLPNELSGGFICMFSIMFSLASEQSSVKNRSLKYTYVEFAFGLGMSFGGLAGGFLYKYYGYVYVYITAAVFHIFGCLWVWLVVKETRGLHLDMKWHEKARDFFVLISISDSVATTFKRRPGNTRLLLLLLLLSMCLIVLNYESFGTVAYVYVHHIFNWDPMIYSIVSTTSMLVNFFMTLFLVPVFIRVFNFNDFTLGIIGTLSMMAKNLLISFSQNHVHIYYAGLAAGVFNGLSTLSIRTGISKLVDKDELGRVFSFLATCESILPMVGTIMVAKIFEITMDTYPNITYAMTVFFLIVPLVTFMWALKSTKTSYRSLRVSSPDEVGEKA